MVGETVGDGRAVAGGILVEVGTTKGSAVGTGEGVIDWQAATSMTRHRQAAVLRLERGANPAIPFPLTLISIQLLVADDVKYPRREVVFHRGALGGPLADL